MRPFFVGWMSIGGEWKGVHFKRGRLVNEEGTCVNCLSRYHFKSIDRCYDGCIAGGRRGFLLTSGISEAAVCVLVPCWKQAEAGVASKSSWLGRVSVVEAKLVWNSAVVPWIMTIVLRSSRTRQAGVPYSDHLVLARCLTVYMIYYLHLQRSLGFE